jgi:hypothetical protein
VPPTLNPPRPITPGVNPVLPNQGTGIRGQASGAPPATAPPAIPPGTPPTGGTGGTGVGAGVGGTPPGTGGTGVGAGVAPGAVGGTGATGIGAGVATTPLSPADQAQINRLIQNLNILRSGTPMTVAGRQQLIAGLRTASTGPVRPSDVLVTRLANNLFTVVPRLNLTGPQLNQLGVDLFRIMNSAGLSPADAQLALSDAQRLLIVPGADAQQAQVVLNDLTAIMTELQREAAGARAPGAQGLPGTQTPGVPGQTLPQPVPNTVPPTTVPR